jgi:iron complex transport system ATP-binding protein
LKNKRAVKKAPALEIRDLSLNLGGSDILKDVSFEVDRGTFLSILGPNGAGKTSLLRCVTGVISGWSGDIRVNGSPVGSYRPRDLARLVSYVPQSDEMAFPFTGRELVMMGRYPYLSPFARLSHADTEIVERTLEATGTASLADRDMRTLSGGERQKILIAGALAQEAGIMLLDEPTNFLDPRHAEEILAILSELNGSGATIVMVTHDLNHAVHYAAAAAAFAEGSLVFKGTTAALMNNEILKTVYGKDFTLVKHPATGRTMALPGGGRL